MEIEMKLYGNKHSITYYIVKQFDIMFVRSTSWFSFMCKYFRKITNTENKSLFSIKSVTLYFVYGVALHFISNAWATYDFILAESSDGMDCWLCCTHNSILIEMSVENHWCYSVELHRLRHGVCVWEARSTQIELPNREANISRNFHFKFQAVNIIQNDILLYIYIKYAYLTCGRANKRYHPETDWYTILAAKQRM